ncbi:GMC family oxidoreductase N-terminal domain-containing protein [Kribbella hippodromi]|uniref:GMC family oxidoreductase N-terminal domain-containing protein n=1 Tax=Kribbella hippodromi TaxID=434347 RepID=A0ABN2CJU7_9ACTN
MARIIVVGAGSAGCVVAARLSAEHEVELVEAGPDWAGTATETRLASANWMDAMASPEAFDPALAATRLAGDAPRQYHRGRGVGGSSSVNAMLALPGLPRDYDRWAEHYGLDEWSWERVEPTFVRLARDLIATPADEYTPMDRALVDAAGALGMATGVDTLTPDDGGGTLWRNADAIGRRSSAAVYLRPVLERGAVVLRTEAKVDRLLREGDAVVGVVLLDGTKVYADQVVLAAGAIETPAILLRSGCSRPGVGKGLQDHPAASLLLALRPSVREVRDGQPCINAVVRTSSSRAEGDIHVLPMQGALSESTPAHHAVVMAAVMTVTSTGEVRLNRDDPTGPPVIAERMLTTERDRQVMREAVGVARRLLETAPFQEIVEAAFIDAAGTPVAALDDPDVYNAWLTSSIGDYFHAVGTARMGTADDPGAVVDQRGRVHGLANVRVIDCSVMPEVPAANTHLPVVMVAERLSAALLADLAPSTSVSASPSASASVSSSEGVADRVHSL